MITLDIERTDRVRRLANRATTMSSMLDELVRDAEELSIDIRISAQSVNGKRNVTLTLFDKVELNQVL